MRVLVTGGSGFIGQHCLTQLYAKGFDVHAVSSVSQVSTPIVRWHKANLLDTEQARTVVSVVQPSHLLHLAWCTQHGQYWTPLDNLNWVQSSLAMIKAFTESGGQRVVVAGTCAEYEWGHGVCIEDQTPLVPATLYGTYKHALQLMLQSWSRQTGLSSAWGRVFSLYGPRENPERLVASVIRALLRGKSTDCENPNLVRDYLHAEDVASAFVALLESEQEGAVNIGSGEGVSLGNIIRLIEKQFRGNGRFQKMMPQDSSNLDMLVADITLLRSIGWKKKYDLESGLAETIKWWRSNS